MEGSFVLARTMQCHECFVNVRKVFVFSCPCFGEPAHRQRAGRVQFTHLHLCLFFIVIVLSLVRGLLAIFAVIISGDAKVEAFKFADR